LGGFKKEANSRRKKKTKRKKEREGRALREYWGVCLRYVYTDGGVQRRPRDSTIVDGFKIKRGIRGERPQKQASTSEGH